MRWFVWQRDVDSIPNPAEWADVEPPEDSVPYEVEPDIWLEEVARSEWRQEGLFDG